MKMIWRGRRQKSWTKICICTGKGNGWKGCWAILRVEKEDLFRTSFYDDFEFFTTFRCSNCKTRTDIRIPIDMRASVRRHESPTEIGENE